MSLRDEKNDALAQSRIKISWRARQASGARYNEIGPMLDGDVETLLAVRRRQDPAVDPEQTAKVGHHVAGIVDDKDAILVLRPVEG